LTAVTAFSGCYFTYAGLLACWACLCMGKYIDSNSRLHKQATT